MQRQKTTIPPDGVRKDGRQAEEGITAKIDGERSRLAYSSTKFIQRTLILSMTVQRCALESTRFPTGTGASD